MTAEVDIDVPLSEVQERILFPDIFPKFTVVTKGRRTGLTRGVAHGMILYGIDDTSPYFPDGDLFFLWGDTINGNIDRYVERYFMPILTKLPREQWKWDSQKKMLKVGRATIDFRSADRPENWEGFGYHLIFLNEAGIILTDDYLYEHAVLPMLMDYEGCKLIAGGVPKGKLNKGEEHKFYQLYKRTKSEPNKYRHVHATPYDNPFISASEIDLLIASMDALTIRQEINGEFIDAGTKPFLYAFNEGTHVKPQEWYTPNPALPLLISFDFNKNPMTALVSQVLGIDEIVIFDEIKMPDGSTPEVCEMLLARYPEWMYFMDVTGDATGHNRSPLVKGNVNHWILIKRDLALKDYNLRVRKINMSHRNSKILCNSALQKLKVTITENCVNTISDCIYANVDEEDQLIKTAAEGRHFFDNVRYLLGCAFEDLITNPQKYGLGIQPTDVEDEE